MDIFYYTLLIAQNILPLCVQYFLIVVNRLLTYPLYSRLNYYYTVIMAKYLILFEYEHLE